jgi:hypothetical protein
MARRSCFPCCVALSQSRAAALAARLELTLDRICLACLSFVAQPVADGDEAGARIWVRRMTPDLWQDGLDQLALAAVRRARERGDPDAAEALADLELSGPRSTVARAIVRRLAEDLVRWEERQRTIQSRARPRLPPERPELN